MSIDGGRTRPPSIKGPAAVGCPGGRPGNARFEARPGVSAVAGAGAARVATGAVTGPSAAGKSTTYGRPHQGDGEQDRPRAPPRWPGDAYVIGTVATQDVVPLSNVVAAVPRAVAGIASPAGSDAVPFVAGPIRV